MFTFVATLGDNYTTSSNRPLIYIDHYITGFNCFALSQRLREHVGTRDHDLDDALAVGALALAVDFEGLCGLVEGEATERRQDEVAGDVRRRTGERRAA